MGVAEILSITWRLLGIPAPWFIWIASASLFLGTLFFVRQLIWHVQREKEALTRCIESVEILRAQASPPPGHGLPASVLESTRQVFEHVDSLATAWAALESVLVCRRSAEDKDEFWLAETSEHVLNEGTVLERRINRSFYLALPGIITGLGLLFTFFAILIALLPVKVQGNVVTGVDVLITGLSGKFVSSIVALFCATVFIALEKHLFHDLDKTRLRLTKALDRLFPRLTPVHILSELQRDIGEQTLAFRHFNADLSGKLRQSFSESMGPTIQRMVETVDELNRLLRAAEAQKQESITSSLATMLQRLEVSLATSLNQMGDRFSESLSGTTMVHLTKVSESLGGAAHLLESMNGQFQMTQAALTELVNLARNSTIEQMTLGKTQMEDLTNVLRQMMVQLNEAANTSTSRMTQTLGALVADLASKITELNSQMAKNVEENASRTTTAASVVIDQAAAWSSKSSEQLEQILQQQRAHLQNVREVEAALMSAVERFKISVGEYAALNSALQNTAREASAMATAAAGAARSSEESQKALQQIAAQTRAQIEYLAQANRAQQEVWESIRERMEQYRNVFAQTEGSAAKLLGQIAQGTTVHLDVTRQKYDALLKAFDEHISSAVGKLGGSVNELGDFLDDLNDLIKKVGGSTDGSRS